MSQNVAQRLDFTAWSPRARFYSMAVLISLCYLTAGRVVNDDTSWVRVHLPLSTASVLLIGLSAAEYYLFMDRSKKRQIQSQIEHTQAVEQSLQLAVHRQTALNEISRSLIDKLDFNQLPPEVLEQIAPLFTADVVAVWVADKAAGAFVLKGSFGIHEASARQLDTVGRTSPSFEKLQAEPRQMIVENFREDMAPAMEWYCGREKIELAVLNPIIRRQALVGVLAMFYRRPVAVTEPMAAEMQTVAHLVASAIQVEELYHDLVQAQKIESIGNLTSGIAHDFNNVLAAIMACASYVKQHTDPQSPCYRYLEATESSAHRGAALTKQLLSFARREGPRLTVLDANECIEQTLKMLERSFEKSILFQRQFARNLRLIEADPSYLEQVILNIAVNARDAMPDGGIFTIGTRNVRLTPDTTNRASIGVPDGDYVVLGFRDTGSGMNQATLKRLFEPFFTTKPPGKGTGLGLSVVRNIIKNFRGDIRVESAVGKGTLFEIFIPATSKPLPAKPAATAKAVRGGSECILVVEDEDVIREMAQLALEAKGYRLLTAPDGASAMALYREKWGEIDLVVADMVMPRMNGAELFARMKEINPNVRVIVSSGYSHDQEGQRMLQHGCLGYLQKPYNSEALNQLVRSILDSGL